MLAYARGNKIFVIWEECFSSATITAHLLHIIGREKYDGFIHGSMSERIPRADISGFASYKINLIKNVLASVILVWTKIIATIIT